MSNNLILTGFSGSGKSQVGLAIAGIQGWDFWDTDEEVVPRLRQVHRRYL